ncbi:MAG: hypothetical protein Q9194_003515 [Teloschistes cf. exilis]
MTPHTEKLGFMDLPTGNYSSIPSRKPHVSLTDCPVEVRLLIYPHLLTASRTEAHHHPNTDREHHRRSGPTTITIEPSLSSPGSVTHHRETEANSKADDEGFAVWDERLEPSILLTCRTIYREAVPFLYATNTFSFRATPALPSSRGDDLMFWDEPAAVTDGDIDSPLPTFLRAIGPHNATNIRSLVLGATDTATAATHLLTALPLTIAHFPNLKYLQLHVDAKYVDWDDPFAPDPTNDEEKANGPLEPMYAALLRFIGRVHWLEGFRYEDTVGQWQFAEDDALETLKGVECIVEEKSWENLEKMEDRRWMKTEGHWRKRALEEDRDAGLLEFWGQIDA